MAKPRGPARWYYTISPGPDSALSRKDRSTEDPLRLDVSAGESISPSTPQADSGPSRCRPTEWATRPVRPSPHRLVTVWRCVRPFEVEDAIRCRQEHTSNDGSIAPMLRVNDDHSVREFAGDIGVVSAIFLCAKLDPMASGVTMPSLPQPCQSSYR